VACESSDSAISFGGTCSTCSAHGLRHLGHLRPIGIDRVLHRALEVVEAPHRLDAAEREVWVTWEGRTRRVRLSDHDPVVAVLRAI